MTYLRTNKRPGEKKMRLLYAIIGFVIFLIVLFQILFPHFLPSIFTSAFRPFWVFNYSRIAGSFDSRDSLLAQNEELKRQMAEYEVRLSTIRSIEEENEVLKGIFGRPVQKTVVSTTTDSGEVSSTTENVDTTTVEELRERANGRLLAAVLIRPPMTGYDEYIIDAGQDLGVKVNDHVYAPGEVLLGKVVDVLDTTAKVQLYSSPGEKYEVTVGSGAEVATAVGRGGGQYEVVLPRDAVVSDGDFVTAPSVSDRPFGVVTAVLSDPAEPFATILFTSTVNIYKVRWVLVGNKK